VKYWDASAILPLLVQEQGSDAALRIFSEDARMTVWWGTKLECASALARIERSISRPPTIVGEAFAKLEKLTKSWVVIQPGERLLGTALRLIRVHPLRAADTLRLAAAVAACDFRTPDITFVCFDKRLAAAAEREGFNVEGLSEPLG
jgi:predicted nucleic acid-binding protein